MLNRTKKEIESYRKQVEKKPELLEMALNAIYDLGYSDCKDSERSPAQNRGLHKDCSLIAEKLNDAGYSLHQIIKMDVPFTMQIIKDHVWRPTMQKMFSKDSTKQLSRKKGEIDQIHDVIMRELGEKRGIEYHPFPHDPKKQKEFEANLSVPKDYPEDNGDPDAIQNAFDQVELK